MTDKRKRRLTALARRIAARKGDEAERDAILRELYAERRDTMEALAACAGITRARVHQIVSKGKA